MRRSYAGAAPDLTLANAVSDTDMTITVAGSTSNWPDGSGGPFYIVLSPDSVNEEKALIASRVGDICTVQTRGADGTEAASHDPAATVRHVFTAVDADEANAHVNATSNIHGVTGSLKTYIDSKTSDHEADPDPHPQYVEKAGDTMTGALVLNGDPSNVLDATPKQYVDAGDAATEATAVADAVSQANAYTDTQLAAYSKEIVGEVRLLAYAAAPPTGWLACQGQAVSRSTYAALFAAIGTVFGAGDGTTTFNLPDLTDRVPMGGGTLGATGGQSSVTLAAANLPSHTHSFSATTSTATVRPRLQMDSTDGTSNNSVKRGTATGWSGPYNTPVEADTHSHTLSGNTGSVGSGTAVDITPKHVRLAYVIWAG